MAALHTLTKLFGVTQFQRSLFGRVLFLRHIMLLVRFYLFEVADTKLKAKMLQIAFLQETRCFTPFLQETLILSIQNDIIIFRGPCHLPSPTTTRDWPVHSLLFWSLLNVSSIIRKIDLKIGQKLLLVNSLLQQD